MRLSSPHIFTDFVDQEFIRLYWDKKPIRLSLPGKSGICDEVTLLEALKRYSEIPDQLKLKNKLAEFVTGVDCVATKEPVKAFAIQNDEASLDTYLTRVDKLNSPREWSVAYFGLHGASEVVWDSAKAFIKKLSMELGYRPGGRVDVDCFVGRYSSTPSGVHVDDAHNFGFTLRPGKTMLTWDPIHAHVKWLKAPGYEPYRKDALPLVNEEGFVCYFPHDALHVGETKERPSVNVNISFWKESEPSKETYQYLFANIANERVLQNKVHGDGRFALSRFKAEDLKRMQNSIRSGGLEAHLAMNDLLEQTTFGLRVPRPVFGTTQLDFDVPIRLKDSATINWYLSDGLEEMLIGVNGHCLSCPKDPDVICFLEKVTDSAEFVVRDLVEPQSDLGMLVRQFHDWGAFYEVL